jgi:hypothetical protein
VRVENKDMVLIQFCFAIGVYGALLATIENFRQVNKIWFICLTIFFSSLAFGNLGLLTLVFLVVIALAIAYLNLKNLKLQLGILQYVTQSAIFLFIMYSWFHLSSILYVSVTVTTIAVLFLVTRESLSRFMHLIYFISYSLMIGFFFTYLVDTNAITIFSGHPGLLLYVYALLSGWVLFHYAIHIGMLFLVRPIVEDGTSYQTLSNYFIFKRYNRVLMIGTFMGSIVLLFSAAPYYESAFMLVAALPGVVDYISSHFSETIVIAN